jgi:hypothetical protein
LEVKNVLKYFSGAAKHRASRPRVMGIQGGGFKDNAGMVPWAGLQQGFDWR